MKLNILMRGVAAKAGNILTPSSHWGDDVIVSSLALRDLRPASALTYVEVATLAREDIDEVLATPEGGGDVTSYNGVTDAAQITADNCVVF